ncbi:TPA: hypothetical protein LK891_001137 [Enterococcus faecium]|uniref:hypothetical protein n=1 Tax=Enterococcus TaxID=1350 RepID=UPI000C303FFD|nr:MULTISPECIES: hypothetical protein [Enterococcus]AUC73496.1 hypothetical protein CWE29_10530 [Enterococcus faecium]MBO6330397.1 hypothetical protein [Enterococcus gallinarum]MBO6353047.1 hypothetical protein [Enterococcus gallinarum]MBO6394863.1 hypothetical protein [Enterococcus gallinarum]MBO6423793.1 hypothetical protein [Enterococcus gallinarum]
MSDPYIKVYCSKETKELFDSFYEKNKGTLGTKANMFRVMVSNLPMLASQSNKKVSDPESIKLEQTISELESIIMKKLNGIDQKLSCSLKNKYKNEEGKDV